MSLVLPTTFSDFLDLRRNLIDSALTTSSDFLKNNELFEVLSSDDPMIQGVHPLLEDKLHLKLQPLFFDLVVFLEFTLLLDH